MKAAEIGQRRAVFQQVFHAPVKGHFFHTRGVIVQLVERFGNLYQDLNQIRDRRPRGADVGHEQDGIARRLVDLDAIFIHQHLVFERITVPARATDQQRHAAGIQHEFVALPAIPQIGPALLGVVIAGDAALAMFLGDHVTGSENLEVFLQKRVVADRAAHGHRRLDLPLHKFKAFQFDLPPSHI